MRMSSASPSGTSLLGSSPDPCSSRSALHGQSSMPDIRPSRSPTQQFCLRCIAVQQAPGPGSSRLACTLPALLAVQ